MATRTEHQQLSFGELLQVIRTLVREQRTGTMFIHTDSNHSVRIGMEDGRIISCAFGKYRGHDALPHIRQIHSGKYSFAEGIFNNSSEIPLPSTQDLLSSFSGESLTTPARESHPAPTIPEPTSPSSTAPPAPSLGDSLLEGSDLSLRGVDLYEALVRELAVHMGPIADMVADDYRDSIVSATRQEQLRPVVHEIAEQLDDPQRTQEFREQAMNLVAG